MFVNHDVGDFELSWSPVSLPLLRPSVVGSDESEGAEAASQSAASTHAVAQIIRSWGTFCCPLIAFMPSCAKSHCWVSVPDDLWNCGTGESWYCAVRRWDGIFVSNMRQHVDNVLNIRALKHVFVLCINSIWLSSLRAFILSGRGRREPSDRECFRLSGCNVSVWVCCWVYPCPQSSSL